ncbi:MAG: serine hydrolase [Anaerolineales bacterium]|jgi:CubicO group peptidase (beta-lactamase class C family)
MKFKTINLKKTLYWILGIVIAVLVLYPLLACLVYPPEYVFRALTWGESDAHDYQKFEKRELAAGDDPFYFAKDLQEEWIRSLFESDPQVDDLDTFLMDTGTQAFIVIQGDRILYEGYLNGAQRDSIVTSFSIAKSFTSALIGITIEDGYIRSSNDPITAYLPELESRDPRFSDITIRDLLMMSSGICYSEDIPLLNDDGTKTYLYPDMRQLALGHTRICESSGEHFLYNNYNPLLLGMILERAAGISVTQLLQQKIWSQLGMEFDGSWSLDSEASGFEKMESGINGRAIDFAKFGRLFLHEGTWEGVRVIPTDWVLESTREDTSVDLSAYYGELEIRKPLDGYYKYMWWGLPRGDGEYDFSAVGIYGQFIYVSPQADLIIVRNGERERHGLHYDEWLRIFYQFATRIDEELG